MKILIAGTGAMACMFASRLTGAGNPVTMLGSWPDGLCALREQGVRLREMDGSTHRHSVTVLDGAHLQGNYSDSLVLVKSWQTNRVAGQLSICLDSSAIALTLQNGVGNYETLVAALGMDRVALGVTTLGACMLAPGYVEHTGDGVVTLGAHPQLAELGELLKKGGFQVETVNDPQSLLWGKLVINAAINPLTALLRVSNGELLSRPSARQLLQETANEAAQVACEKGIKLPYANPVEAVEQVATHTASNISSMLQDVLRGTPTEIDAINGAIIREGEQVGVPTPLNRMLWRFVKGLEGQSLLNQAMEWSG